MEQKLSDHVVEDGFSYEAGGLGERNFRQMFTGFPRTVLQRLLNHFRQRREWEVCRIIRDLISASDNVKMA
jgi:hypothetical protein